MDEVPRGYTGARAIAVGSVIIVAAFAYTWFGVASLREPGGSRVMGIFFVLCALPIWVCGVGVAAVGVADIVRSGLDHRRAPRCQVGDEKNSRANE